MPHLDASALETDPEGMALLRAAIRPQPEGESFTLVLEQPRPRASLVRDALQRVRLHVEPRICRLVRLPAALA
ncbi:hypothetical protein [Alsobacter sp. R-9]